MCATNNSGKGKLAANTLEVIVLPDGRVRIQTGSFAGASHTSAEKMRLVLLEELGVTVERRESLGHVHHHAHEHDHAHDHDHQHIGGKE